MTGICIICNMKLIVPSWKYCQECDPKKVKDIKKNKRIEEKTMKKVIVKNFQEIIQSFTIDDHIKYRSLHEKSCLIYDENRMIIGYK